MKSFKIENPYNHRMLHTPFGVFDMDILGHIVLNADKTLFKIMLWKCDFNLGSLGYFRGQNKEFKTFKTSWQRLETPIDKCLAWIQKKEFIRWFMQTPYFQHFCSNFELEYPKGVPEGQGVKFCFDFEAIAQHYGFATNYLDMTTQKDVAKFFAYTYWDNKSEKYRPVEDFSLFKPHLFSSNFSSALMNPFNEDVRIVGFQPLRRPICQFAMAISYENPKHDYNKEFYKEALPQEKAAAFEIFDKFEGGAALFPEEYPSLAARLVKDRVINEKLVQHGLLTDYCKEFNQNQTELEKILINKGYAFSEDVLLISDEAKGHMQKDIDETLMPWLNEYTIFSPRYP